MKVDLGQKGGKKITTLKCGDCFLAQRTAGKREGLYMIVDSKSGLTYSKPHSIFAVNLESGQLRVFDNQIVISPIECSVKFS